MENNAKFCGADKSLKEAPKPNLENEVLESKKGTNMMKNTKGSINSKKNVKGLGVTGLVFLGIAAVVAVVLYILLIKPAYALFSTANILKKDTNMIGEALGNRDLIALNESLDKAAQDLGANHLYSIHKIIIPLLQSSLASAWLICFTLSFDDVLISYFTSGPSFQILPLYIYSLIRTGVTPELNALCSLVFLFSLLTIGSAYALLNKANK